MAVQYISVNLRASHPEGSRVTHADFAGRFDIKPDDPIVEVTKSKSKWMAARIVFLDIEKKNFMDADEPSEAFEHAIAERLHAAAGWLERQPVELFDQIRDSGFDCDVFIGGWMDSDQFDLDLPADFMFACGKRGIPVSICTND